MTADRELRLLARAHGLADLDDLAEEVTGILGGARAARLDPDALPGLAGAALALGAGSLAVYRAKAPRFAGDGEFAAAVDEADAAIASQADAAGRLRVETGAALGTARADLETAHAELGAARAMAVTRPCTGCHAARQAAISAAEEHIAQARKRIACAEAARDVLDALAERLRHALACLRRVMPDVAEVYEPVYDLRHQGHVMPKDGDWLTGQDRAG